MLVGNDRAVMDVLDVSPQGMRVRQNGLLLVPEDVVTVQIHNKNYQSRVTWSKEREAGLSFQQPLPPDVHALVSRSHRSQRKGRFLPGV